MDQLTSADAPEPVEESGRAVGARLSWAGAAGAGMVAVITGASRGLGAGMAQRLAQRGLRLGLCARAMPPRPAGTDPAAVVVAELDVTDPEAVDAFAATVVERLGPIGLWINNAGVLGPIGPLVEADPAEVARHLAVNVLGVVHGTRTYARHVR